MAYNTIKVKKYSDVIEEYLAGGAITPGHLIALTSATANTVVVHPTTGGNVLPMFALENELLGKTIDEAYASGEPVQCWIPGRGDEVYALLEDGQSVTKGQFLGSTGSGTLRLLTDESAGPVEAIVGVALETVDLSASANESADGRILIKII